MQLDANVKLASLLYAGALTRQAEVTHEVGTRQDHEAIAAQRVADYEVRWAHRDLVLAVERAAIESLTTT